MTLSFGVQNKGLSDILGWYEFQAEILREEKTRVTGQLISGEKPSKPIFFAMTRQDVEGFFDRQHNELDFLAMLDLLAATEAALQLDYVQKVTERKRDAVSQEFLRIAQELRKHKPPADRVNFEEHILDTWRDFHPPTKRPVSQFKGVLPLRHWLAHGRYWRPQMGRRYDSARDVYDTALDLLQSARIYP